MKIHQEICDNKFIKLHLYRHRLGFYLKILKFKVYTESWPEISYKLILKIHIFLNITFGCFELDI